MFYISLLNYKIFSTFYLERSKNGIMQERENLFKVDLVFLALESSKLGRNVKKNQFFKAV